MLTSLIAAIAMAQGEMPQVRLSWKPDTGGKNDFYLGNKAPLVPAPFRKLPIGAIRPEGWLRKQLELEADGFTGHLDELSEYLNKKDNAWLSPTGEGVHGWEEVPYWLKGFGDLGYVLGDRRIIDEAKVWIEGVLSSSQPDGWFGPKSNRGTIQLSGPTKASEDTRHNPKDTPPDMWPNMVMLFALQSYYEYSGDHRVIDLMSRYFKWQLALPEDQFYQSYWEKQRGGDNMASVYWLYNRTGEPWLLDLVRKIHRRTADWVSGIPDLHGVNFAQAFREPAQYGTLEQDPKLFNATLRDYIQMRERFGLVPGGLYGADENARPGFNDPRQATETCAMVESMLSDEILLAQTGEALYAEQCEDVTFNSLPASMTPDLKALHYLTAPNMALLDAKSKSPGLQNGGPMLLMNPWDHRCCQHNVSHGWPYFSENLWYATDHNGLAAAMYAPCEVTAKVGNGQTATIKEETDYPFRDTVTFRISLDHPSRFPLTLRLSSLDNAWFALNGHKHGFPEPGGYAIIDNEWKNGDVVVLHFRWKPRVIHWNTHRDAVSVLRGPLWYSLKIGEKYVRNGGTDKWPAFEIHPSTPWNYGLASEKFKVIEHPMPENQQPFEANSAPIELRAEARLIPEWQLDHYGLVAPLQQSPAKTQEPVECVTLIPMGAARLRISVFPTVAVDKGNKWTPPSKTKQPLPASASHVYEGDTLDALSDGLIPTNSDDESIARFTWWDHKGTAEWVEYDLPNSKTVSVAEVYWFDDGRSGGGCRVPKSWRLLYWESGDWKPVTYEEAYGTDLDRFNPVHFKPVESTKFRIEAQLQPGFSGGILEWVLR